MHNSIKDLYKRHRSVFTFKGNRPGESLNTKIQELALIGDSYLYLEVRTKLVFAGLTPNQISLSTSKYLSNAGLTRLACELEIIPDTNYGQHAAGTLLEALFGFWYIASRKRESKTLIHTPYSASFHSAIDALVRECVEEHRSEGLFKRLFSQPGDDD